MVIKFDFVSRKYDLQSRKQSWILNHPLERLFDSLLALKWHFWLGISELFNFKKYIFLYIEPNLTANGIYCQFHRYWNDSVSLFEFFSELSEIKTTNGERKRLRSNLFRFDPSFFESNYFDIDDSPSQKI